MRTEAVRLYLGLEHECSYLPERNARSAFVDPALALDAAQYGELLSLGFRRSGEFVYRPACLGCRQCIPSRVPVADFQPQRSHRRCLQRNKDLQWQRQARLGPEHFELYRRYLNARHPDGGMDADDEEAFHRFLDGVWPGTEIWGLLKEQQLLAVAVVDVVPDGLSAVYTFFEPDAEERGLGTFSILQQITEAQRRSLRYLYLGYWIPDCQKMAYKARFRPLQILQDNQWKTLTAP